jgi:hypothetical protein
MVTLGVCLWPLAAAAQQRPLVTEDPEPVGAGRILIEAGVDYERDAQYTVSGLKGSLVRAPVLGISIGISSIAEFQLDGGFYNRLKITQRKDAPLASLVDVTGDTTHDVEDLVVATKIRMAPETPGRPSLGLRMATKLPNASNESGLGLDTTDFYASLLMGKTVQSLRLVGNLGVGILGDPTDGNRQNDVMTYGLSFARALTQGTEIVGELNGRVSTRNGVPFPGTETRGLIRLGARYTRGALRVDGAVLFGMNAIDPTIGATAGFTYVFNAFTVP